MLGKVLVSRFESEIQLLLGAITGFGLGTALGLGLGTCLGLGLDTDFE